MQNLGIVAVALAVAVKSRRFYHRAHRGHRGHREKDFSGKKIKDNTEWHNLN